MEETGPVESQLDERERETDLRQRLSVVLVTSAVRTHPQTDVIDAVIASLVLVNGLADCDLIIVCDAPKSVADAKGNHWKSGILTDESFANYLKYIENLRMKYERREGTVSSRGNTTILEMKSHLGFAYCLHEGLKVAKSRGHLYVMALQHDRAFVEKCEIQPIVDIFDQYPTIRYIGFQSVATQDYIHRFLHTRYRLAEYTEEDLFAQEQRWKNSLDSTDPPPLIPLIFWYDSTHVCRVDEYLTLIETECKTGQFIEDTYGHRLAQQIVAGYENRAKAGLRKATETSLWEFHMMNFGLFLWYDGDIGLKKPTVRHIDGRKYLTEAQREERGWPATSLRNQSVSNLLK